VRAAAHPWPPSAHTQQQLQGLAQLQQGLAALAASADATAAHTVGGAAAGAVALVSTSSSSGSSSGSSSSSSSSDSGGAAGTVGSKRRRPRLAAAAAHAAQAAAAGAAEQQRPTQQRQLPPVLVPPLEYWAPGDPLPASNSLIEVLLQRSAPCAPHQLAHGYIWTDIVMVSKRRRRLCVCGCTMPRCGEGSRLAATIGVVW
jgi:hypothetical protein